MTEPRGFLNKIARPRGFTTQVGFAFGVALPPDRRVITVGLELFNKLPVPQYDEQAVEP